MRFHRLFVLSVVFFLLLGCQGSPSTPAPATPAPASPSAPAVTKVPSTPTEPAAKSSSPAATKAPATPSVPDESAVPAEWIEGAKKEGKLTAMGAIEPAEFEPTARHFKEKYPFITEVNYVKASQEVRAVKTIAEYKQGRVSTDIVMGLAGLMSSYKEANALVDLRQIPMYKVYPEQVKDPDGRWIATDVEYWGIAYNTNLVKKEDLPRTWEQLADPKWKGKQVALSNRPQLYALMLWKHWGPDKTKDFFQKLFANGPQLRKEGLTAMIDLLANGEWTMHLPASPYRVKGVADKNRPVAWYSPEPLLVMGEDIAIMNNSPSPNAAKLFVNWCTGKEGQIWAYKDSTASPAHPALRTAEFLPYPDAMIGKAWSYRAPEDDVKTLPMVEELFKTLWIQ